MIREEINELFVQLYAYNSKPNNDINIFQNIISQAFNLLDDLQKNYYLIPQENIENKITFSSNENEDGSFKNYYASFKIMSKLTIKKNIGDIYSNDKYLKDVIPNNLKINLKKELEKKCM